MFQGGYSFLDPQLRYISWVKDYLSMAPSLAQCSLSSFNKRELSNDKTKMSKTKRRKKKGDILCFNGLNYENESTYFSLNFKLINSEHGIHGRHISSTCARGKGWIPTVFFHPPPFSSRHGFVKNPSKNCRSSLKYDIWSYIYYIIHMIIYDL